MAEIDDKNPFGGTFDRKPLQEDTPQRDYALSGSPVKTEKPADTVEIERVEFDYSQFDQQIQSAAIDEEEDNNEIGSGEQTQTQYNADLDDPDEVALNKKVQAKLAKSQAKNIAGIYLMILKAAWRWLGKYREDKLHIMHIRGEIDVNIIIRDHPFIETIRNMNAEVDEWELDSDSIEAIVDALEIYLVSQNIQTSPGMNLAMAMGVPAIEMLSKAWANKREIKSMVAAVSEMHLQNKKALKQQQGLQQSQQQKIIELEKTLEAERLRNEKLMNPSLGANIETTTTEKPTNQRQTTRRSKNTGPKKENPFPKPKHNSPVVQSDEKLNKKTEEADGNSKSDK